MTWHRIDDPENPAPKDGTEIYVYRECQGWHVYGKATWVDLPGFSDGGWLSEGLSDPPGNLGLGHPTHWLPMDGIDPANLPNPPEKERT